MRDIMLQFQIPSVPHRADMGLGGRVDADTGLGGRVAADEGRCGVAYALCSRAANPSSTTRSAAGASLRKRGAWRCCACPAARAEGEARLSLHSARPAGALRGVHTRHRHSLASSCISGITVIPGPADEGRDDGRDAGESAGGACPRRDDATLPADEGRDDGGCDGGACGVARPSSAASSPPPTEKPTRSRMLPVAD